MGVLQVAGVRRCSFRIHYALPAVDEILRRHRLAVGPFGVFTQVEGPDFEIFVIPAFRDARHDGTVRAVVRQAFHQIAGDVVFRHALDFMRVKRLHFGTVIFDNFLLVGQLHAGRNVGGKGGGGCCDAQRGDDAGGNERFLRDVGHTYRLQFLLSQALRGTCVARKRTLFSRRRGTNAAAGLPYIPPRVSARNTPFTA